MPKSVRGSGTAWGVVVNAKLEGGKRKNVDPKRARANRLLLDQLHAIVAQAAMLSVKRNSATGTPRTGSMGTKLKEKPTLEPDEIATEPVPLRARTSEAVRGGMGKLKLATKLLRLGRNRLRGRLESLSETLVRKSSRTLSAKLTVSFKVVENGPLLKEPSILTIKAAEAELAPSTVPAVAVKAVKKTV